MTEMRNEKRETLKEMSHTAPYTDEAFGDAMVYHRGPVVAADGGSRTGEDSVEQLADVEHTPPYGESVNRVYERGTEGRNESA